MALPLVDTFIRTANLTSLNPPSDAGVSWTTADLGSAGVWGTNGTAAWIPTTYGDSWDFALRDTGVTDYSVEIVFPTVRTDNVVYAPGIVLRYVDTNNFLSFGFSAENGGSMEFKGRLAGSWTTWDTMTTLGTFVNGGRFRVNAVGDTVTVFYKPPAGADTQIYTKTDTGLNSTGTLVGIFNTATLSDGTTYTSFKARAPGADPASGSSPAPVISLLTNRGV